MPAYRQFCPALGSDAQMTEGRGKRIIHRDQTGPYVAEIWLVPGARSLQAPSGVLRPPHNPPAHLLCTTTSWAPLLCATDHPGKKPPESTWSPMVTTRVPWLLESELWLTPPRRQISADIEEPSEQWSGTHDTRSQPSWRKHRRNHGDQHH